MCYRSHNVVKTFCLSVLQSYDPVFKCKLLTNTLKLHVGIRTCTLVPCYWGYTSCWNWLANPSYYYYYWCGTCIIELFEFAIFANGHTKREFREIQLNPSEKDGPYGTFESQYLLACDVFTMLKYVWFIVFSLYTPCTCSLLLFCNLLNVGTGCFVFDMHATLNYCSLTIACHPQCLFDMYFCLYMYM